MWGLQQSSKVASCCPLKPEALRHRYHGGSSTPRLGRQLALGMMATRSDEPDEQNRSELKEANRQLNLALEECQALLKRTEEMLRRSQQDNQRPYTD